MPFLIRMKNRFFILFVYTISESKFTSFFLSIKLQWDFGWFINWPKGMSYAAWQSLLKRALWFIGRKKKSQRSKRKKHSSKQRLPKQANIQCVEQQTEPIVHELKTLKAVSEDVKLELITLLKHFWDKKHVSRSSVRCDIMTFCKMS